MKNIRNRLFLITLITLLTACGGGGGGNGSGDDNGQTESSYCSAFDPPADAEIALEPMFFNLNFTQPVALVQHPTDDNVWFVVEQAGRILRVEGPDDTAADVVLDITEGIVSGGETGLLGLAFHPEFASNGSLFVCYTAGSPLVSYISRMHSNDNGLSVEAGSEEVLILIDQPYSNHNGGQLGFGPDGYLYVGLGDGGSGGDPFGNGQNTESLLGAMLRIDVDSSDPVRGTLYAIPDSNPFAANANCDQGGCPELFAWGFRNPWRWSFDSLTGDLWAGDVGQNQWEEIDLVEMGANYGWNILEGNHCYGVETCDDAGLMPPVAEYDHSVGNSVTGGYVYRGAAMPSLFGDYVYGDFGSGRIWRIIDAAQGGTQTELLLVSGLNIASFSQGRSGEIYLVSYGDGSVYKLVDVVDSAGDLPQQLSQTGYFSAADPAEPLNCFVPYTVNAPFWSDGLDKQRWLALPQGAVIDNSDDANWSFPDGSVLIKTFLINEVPVETRLLMRHYDGKWAGYTYEWNDDLTDADLVSGGKTKQVDGRTWIFPSSSDCLRCHTTAAGRTLGLETGQLNGDLFYPAENATLNQLDYLASNDMLFQAPPDQAPIVPDPFAGGVDLGQRARAYLHTNCSACHRPDGPTPSTMDLRFTTAPADMAVCDQPVLGADLGVVDPRLLAPGLPDKSILLLRTQRRDTYAMPPLASEMADVQGGALLREWILGLDQCP